MQNNLYFLHQHYPRLKTLSIQCGKIFLEALDCLHLFNNPACRDVSQKWRVCGYEHISFI